MQIQEKSSQPDKKPQSIFCAQLIFHEFNLFSIDNLCNNQFEGDENKIKVV